MRAERGIGDRPRLLRAKSIRQVVSPGCSALILIWLAWSSIAQASTNRCVARKFLDASRAVHQEVRPDPHNGRGKATHFERACTTEPRLTADDIAMVSTHLRAVATSDAGSSCTESRRRLTARYFLKMGKTITALLLEVRPRFIRRRSPSSLRSLQKALDALVPTGVCPESIDANKIAVATHQSLTALFMKLVPCANVPPDSLAVLLGDRGASFYARIASAGYPTISSVKLCPHPDYLEKSELPLALEATLTDSAESKSAFAASFFPRLGDVVIVAPRPASGVFTVLGDGGGVTFSGTGSVEVVNQRSQARVTRQATDGCVAASECDHLGSAYWKCLEQIFREQCTQGNPFGNLCIALATCFAEGGPISCTFAVLEGIWVTGTTKCESNTGRCCLSNLGEQECSPRGRCRMTGECDIFDAFTDGRRCNGLLGEYPYCEGSVDIRHGECRGNRCSPAPLRKCIFGCCGPPGSASCASADLRRSAQDELESCENPTATSTTASTATVVTETPTEMPSPTEVTTITPADASPTAHRTGTPTISQLATPSMTQDALASQTPTPPTSQTPTEVPPLLAVLLSGHIEQGEFSGFNRPAKHFFPDDQGGGRFGVVSSGGTFTASDDAVDTPSGSRSGHIEYVLAASQSQVTVDVQANFTVDHGVFAYFRVGSDVHLCFSGGPGTEYLVVRTDTATIQVADNERDRVDGGFGASHAWGGNGATTFSVTALGNENAGSVTRSSEPLTVRIPPSGSTVELPGYPGIRFTCGGSPESIVADSISSLWSGGSASVQAHVVFTVELIQ